MGNPAERIVNLALFLASARSPVHVDRIREEVAGYSEGQDEPSFLRMFERDKEELRATGLVVESTPEGTYRLDASRSFCEEFELSAEEELAIVAAGSALLGDPSFPFTDDLRRALVKIASATDSPAPVATHVADEDPAEQGAVVATLAAASTARKRVSFGYTNSAGRSADHEVEPYGLFLREGRWYLVARDIAIDEIRVYAVSRMSEPVTNASRPKTPDFEVADDFDVSTFIGLPFQYGPGPAFEATLRFCGAAAWRAEPLSAGAGRLEPAGADVLWHVSARDGRALLRWVVAHGPGIEIIAPDGLVPAVESALASVVEAHG